MMSQNCLVWETPPPPHMVTRSVRNEVLRGKASHKTFSSNTWETTGSPKMETACVHFNLPFTHTLSLVLIQVAVPLPYLSFWTTMDWTLYWTISGCWPSFASKCWSLVPIYSILPAAAASLPCQLKLQGQHRSESLALVCSGGEVRLCDPT